ncbi:hypothetical protein [Propionivibrio dicarboxylicus]|uniref:Uncharacterized protein n=1 Tax=Propionivibrio dicarboxylicus TaxID=83767 RepID=A0A1G8FW72_9RHOO|nr:hypothetical protein [Propionivibrio dicarboxylicus]SDH86310.1 hypothetical protein SAMN05660652_02447 [Propionivibrio dicarboxylicus]
MARRNDLDWDLIETEWRVAQLSIRQIAEKHGTEASTITRRAKKNGWTRDLTEAVRAATKAKVRNAVAHATQQNAERCTQLITSEVDLAANVNATIILRQQGRADRMADMFETLVLENEAVNKAPEALDEIATAIREDDPKGAESIKRLKSLTARIHNLKVLSEINTRLNDAEDSAFNLKEIGKENGRYEKLLAEIIAEDGS